MSVVALGLAETIREWFSGHGQGGGTAVETARPVEVATKPKTARSTKKKKVEGSPADHDEQSGGGDVATAEAPPRVTDAPPARQETATAPQPTAEPVAPVRVAPA